MGIAKFNTKVGGLPSSSRRAAIDPEERLFARDRRAMGASWNAIAKMLGRGVPDVRMACDPDYVRDANARENAAPPPPVEDAPTIKASGATIPPHRPIRPGTLDARILLLLRRHTLSASCIAFDLTADRRYVGQRISMLDGYGLIRPGSDASPRRFYLTDAGKREVQQIRELEAARP
ncbi:MAG: hypothetical protein WA840_22945 [Caulobacteraceae bacterium]